MTDQVVQVAVDRDRSTGLATVTIRLTGWSIKELIRFASLLWLQRETEKVGRALSKRLEGGKR
jgi:hypothetical protein